MASMVMAHAFLASADLGWFSAGLVTEAPDGSLQLVSAPGRFLAWILAFIIVCPICGWCWRRKLGIPFTPALFVTSFVVPLLIVPGMLRERIQLSPGGLTIRTGFWFAMTVHEFPLSELESVKDLTEKNGDIFWHFRYRSGELLTLNLPELLEANRGRFLAYFKQRGVRVLTE